MKEIKNVLVVCIDRDNDLGRKANITGPVVGRSKNLNSAAKLALSDPSDSDVNSIFAAVKKFDEVKGQFSNAEIATLTGHGKTGFESDRKISEQLDSVLEKFPADGFVLVTDGAEDDQTMPILQGRAPIISKELVVVKQAREVEGTYYTIKEALRDPAIARIVFLVPGIVVMLWGVLFYLGQERTFFQAISLVVGAYLILKGTGIEEKIAATVGGVGRAISLQRVSFPFYLMTILIFVFGLFAGYSELTNPANTTVFSQVASAVEQTIYFAAISALSFLVGRGIDALHLKKAFYLRKYFLSAVAVVTFWFIADSSRRVVIGEPYAGLEWFSLNILISFVFALAAYRISGVLDVTKKITKLLIGLPVYGKDGAWIGKVEGVSKAKNTIDYRDIKSKEVLTLRRKEFVLREGRVMVAG